MLTFGPELICIHSCIASPSLCRRSGLQSATIDRLVIGRKADNPGPLTLDWISVYCIAAKAQRLGTINVMPLHDSGSEDTGM